MNRVAADAREGVAARDPRQGSADDDERQGGAVPHHVERQFRAAVRCGSRFRLRLELDRRCLCRLGIDAMRGALAAGGLDESRMRASYSMRSSRPSWPGTGASRRARASQRPRQPISLDQVTSAGREQASSSCPDHTSGSIASLWPSADYFRSSPVNGRHQGK